jgi:chromate transport protein ChrA
MNRYRFLMWPGYLIAASLIFIPLLDTVLSTLPWRPGAVDWRFGATGLFSRAAMTPLLGVFVVLLLATYFEQHRVIRVVAILCGAMAVAIVAAVILFGLDAIQMRRQVRPEAKRALDVASALALFKYLWTWIVLVLTTIAAWKASRAAGNREARPQSTPLISTAGVSVPHVKEG